jgi:hypothetical protein
MVGLDGVLVPISLSVYWPNDGCSLVLLFVSFCAFDSTFFIQGVGRECQMIIKEKAHLHRSLVVDKAVTLHRVMVGVVAIRACGVTHCRW